MTGREPAKIFLVKLAHRQNPDVAGGYWPDANPDAPVGWIMGDDLEECAELCRSYISDHGFGGGNWSGGAVVVAGIDDDPETLQPIARISYNGRIFRAG